MYFSSQISLCGQWDQAGGAAAFGAEEAQLQQSTSRVDFARVLYNEGAYGKGKTMNAPLCQEEVVF